MRKPVRMIWVNLESGYMGSKTLVRTGAGQELRIELDRNHAGASKLIQNSSYIGTYVAGYPVAVLSLDFILSTFHYY